MSVITNEVQEFISVEAVVTKHRATGEANLIGCKTLQLSVSGACVTVEPEGYVVVDFGREYTGGIRILVCNAAGAEHEVPIRVRFGESVNECMAQKGEKNSGDHHSSRDFSVTVQNLSDIRLGSSAFRFARIDNIGQHVLKITNVLLCYIHCDARQLGEFKSDDALVNTIFDTACRTLFLNMQNKVILDGAKRDRLVWSGDLNPEVLTAMYTYGDVENIPNSLDMCKKDFPLPCWMNTIPSYSLWYIISVCDYYMFSGDASFVKSSREYIDGIVSQVRRCTDEQGEIDFLAENTKIYTWRPYFIDWPSSQNEGIREGVKALIRIALQKLRKVYAFVAIENDEIEVLYKLIGKSGSGHSPDKQIIALQTLADINAVPDADKRLLNGGEKGMSTFMSYYILKAISKLGHKKEAVRIMKNYFGAMLRLGATTFFEDFETEWAENSYGIDRLPQEGKRDIHGDFGKFCYNGFRHSLCHGWASGAVPFLLEDVLGVEIVEPGCRKISIKPDLCGLNHLQGAIATPYGRMDIVHTVCDGRVVTRVDAPKEVEWTVSL